jgi:hypothetical protein
MPIGDVRVDAFLDGVLGARPGLGVGALAACPPSASAAFDQQLALKLALDRILDRLEVIEKGLVVVADGLAQLCQGPPLVAPAQDAPSPGDVLFAAIRAASQR